MKRFEIILVQIFAAVGSYLILSMPFAFGLQVSIFTSDSQEFPATIPDFTQLIEKGFSYPYRQNTQYIKITLSGKDPGKTISKVYLYRCKDYNPIQCLQNGILPVISVSPFNATLWFNDETKWNEVQRNGIANFLTIVKMEISGKEVWAGSWDIIEKTGIKDFTPKNYNLDKLNVYLKSGIQGQAAKSHVESYLSIPTSWVDHSVLTLVDGSAVNRLYELTGNENEVDPSGTGTPTFYAGILTGNSFNGSSKNWAFVFGGNGKLSNPVTFYSGEGEAPPIVTGGASLRIDNWNPQIVACGSQDVINVTAHVENASAINCGEAECYFQDYYYKIDDVQSGPGSITCSITSPSENIYRYSCSIPADKLPACPAPKTSTFSLYFSYKNNVVLSGEFPITLESPPASLVVNSVMPSIFDCGIDSELTADLRVTNPPAGTPQTFYTFDGVNFETMSCSGSFLCKIPEEKICSLLQEDLNLKFRFKYADTEISSESVNLHVTFPPPSLGIDTVTPEVLTAGENTTADILLHVNYPDSMTYEVGNFKYKYFDNAFQSATCSLDKSFANIKYYTCSIALNIPLERVGVEEITFRLDGYQGSELKSLLANHFITIKSPPPEPSLTIISTTSPLDCVTDSSMTVRARTDNIQGTPETYYSVGGNQSFTSLTCSSSGNAYTCHIPKESLCPLMSNSLDLLLKFSYPGRELVSNLQKIYISLPEPHIQVYSVYPNVLSAGKTTQTSVNLYVQYPETISSSPKFIYSYLDKADQSMNCQKVSSTSIRDYYRCSQTGFTIPVDYTGSQISILFAIEGTTLTFPFNIPVTSEGLGVEPWVNVYSSIPGKIEVEAGNSTQATLLITVNNAAENNLKHSATLQPSNWITSGTCEESGIGYDFSCDVTISAPKDAVVGANDIDVDVRVSNGKTYTLVNQTKVYVLQGEFYLDIQTLTPDRLYCQGHSQQNPEQVKVNAKLTNLQADSLLQERIIFNGGEIQHTDRYCTFQANTITCNIPTDKLLEKVTCGQGDLAPGEGTHYYQFSLNILFKKGGQQLQVSGSKDLAVEAIPLQAYLEIIDTDIDNGFLVEPINCLGSKTIKLGEGGNYIRIRYADLLHQTPDESDLTWSFRLDANDEKGKLTKGMGVSPTANATICKMKNYQKVGVHRYEDYQCTLFVDRQMFQRCADGEGTIKLTVVSTTMGRSAEGEFGVEIGRGEDDFNLYVHVEKDASEEIPCWISSYDGRCQLEYSQLNTTIAIKNRAQGDIGDLRLFDADIQFKGGDVDADVYSPYCRESAQGSRKYLCGFGIRPTIKIEEEVTNDTEQTFSDVDLGELEFTTLVKYADGLAEDSLSAKIGSVTIKPKKHPNFIDFEKQKEKMKGVTKTVKDIIKAVMSIAGFCITCAAGTWAYEEMTKPGENGQEETKDDGTKDKAKESPYDPNDYVPETGKIGFSPDKTCEEACGTWEYYCATSDCTLGYEHVTEGDNWCSENTDGLYCCCPSPEEELISVPQMPTGVGAGSAVTEMVEKEIKKSEDKLKDPECKSWKCGILGFLLIVGVFTALVWWVTDKIEGDEPGEYQKAFTKYMWFGISCMLLQFGGEKIEGDIGKFLGGLGKFLYNACVFLGKNFPTVIALLTIVMRWMTFQICVEDIERSLEQGYYGSSGGAESYRSSLIGTQSALSRLQGCLNQFNQISQDAWRIGQTMYYSGASVWGSASFKLYKSSGQEIKTTATICGSGNLRYEVKNWCKVVNEMGIDAQWIKISSTESGKSCSKTIYSLEYCRGYSYGAGAYGWGGGGYRPLHQTPGSKEEPLNPVSLCRDKTGDIHTYHISVGGVGKYYTITYKPTC